MNRVSNMQIFWAMLLGATLLASAFSLVDLQYRTRRVFVEHERELDVARRLQDDRSELQMLVRRASLPGNIVEGAREMGLRGATGDNTVMLVLDADGRVTLSKETAARIEAEKSAAEEAARKAREKAEKARRRGGRE